MDGTKELPAHLQVRLFKSIAATDFVGRLMSQLQHFPILGGRQACFGDSFSSLLNPQATRAARKVSNWLEQFHSRCIGNGWSTPFRRAQLPAVPGPLFS